MTHRIIAAADGSALGNPGPAGWAWYIDQDNWASGGWDHGTNNMGELKAVLDLFEATAHLPESHLTVICDSQYVINSLTRWMPAWKKKGWKKSDGKPVLNRELMEELDAALAGRSYDFEWVKGHSGHRLNEEADRLAQAAARAYQEGTLPDQGPGCRLLEQETDLPEEEPVAERSQDDLALVLALEGQLAQPALYQSLQRTSGLLEPAFTWVLPTGRVISRSEVLEHRLRAFPLQGEPTYLQQRQLGPGQVLLLSSLETARGPVIRSSLWVQRAGSWQLAYRQESARP